MQALSIKEGHLRIIDRAKDVGKLNDGSHVCSEIYVENKLKFFPNIKEAVAFGDGRDYCCVFLNIDLTSVGNWAERNNICLCFLSGTGRPSRSLQDDGRVTSIR